MVRMRGFKERIDVNTALKLLGDVKLKKVNSEVVKIEDACFRILAEDVVSSFDVPHFDRSAVDGYAVFAEDTFGASLNNPVRLKLVGEEMSKMRRGETVRVYTGSPIPDGANAVVMLEFAKEVDGFVEIYRSVTPLENVSRKGEDVKAGDIVLRSGEILQPQDIGVLASLNYGKVRVLRKPKVVVIPTGDELVEVGEGLEFGKVINSNAYMLICALKCYGCEPIHYGIVKDDFYELRKAIKTAVEIGDCVITTGGTSVGKRDLVPEVVREIGRILFHGISIKPGMPTAFGVVNEKPVLILSGFPVACLIGFELLFPHILSKLTGVTIFRRRIVRAKLKRRIPSKAGVRTFARVKYKDGFAEPLMTSGSGILTSMIKANGIVVIPENSEGFEEGEVVDVILIRDSSEYVPPPKHPYEGF